MKKVWIVEYQEMKHGYDRFCHSITHPILGAFTTKKKAIEHIKFIATSQNYEINEVDPDSPSKYYYDYKIKNFKAYGKENVSAGYSVGYIEVE